MSDEVKENIYGWNIWILENGLGEFSYDDAWELSVRAEKWCNQRESIIDLAGNDRAITNEEWVDAFKSVIPQFMVEKNFFNKLNDILPIKDDSNNKILKTHKL